MEWNGTMFGNVDWPPNASCRFVSISWASCYVHCVNCFMSWFHVYCYCYYLQCRIPPFMRQCWGLQVGPVPETTEMEKLINNAALLSLMRRVWVYAVLPSSWVNSSALVVCKRNRVTREVGRVGLVWRDRGGGDIEWHCTSIFILPSF